MKETILITGAGPNGITGRRIKDWFIERGEYDILAPSSKELNLTDSVAVDQYFSLHNIDYVIHSAVVYPQKDGYDDFYLNLKMFFNLKSHDSEFKKMIYFGSGAEYDKRRNIINAREEEIGKYIPDTTYGLSKYIMSQQTAIEPSKLLNIRLFGTINPNEKPTKNVITNICYKVINGLPLKLHRDCRFSFTDIDDVIRFIDYVLKHELKYNDYNFVPSQSYLLSEIGAKIIKIANRDDQLTFIEEGLNREYTASNARIEEEFSEFTPIEESLRKVYQFMKKSSTDTKIVDIDRRWN